MTPWTAAYQAPLSRDFPGKSTGVGCHCLLIRSIIHISICLSHYSSTICLKDFFSPELPWSFYAIYYMYTILVLNYTLPQPMYLYITQYCLDYYGLYQVIQFSWFVIIQDNFKYCIFSTFSYKFQNKIFCFHTKNLWKKFCLRLKRESQLSPLQPQGL